MARMGEKYRKLVVKKNFKRKEHLDLRHIGEAND